MDKSLSIIVPPQNKGWILDTMAQKIAAYHEGDVNVFYNYDNLPKDSIVFAMHYSILPALMALNKEVSDWGVLFTHESADLKKYVPFLNRCKSVIVPNEREMDRLIKVGVKETILFVVPEGDDPEKWKSHRRLERKILISQAFYPRKNPDLIMKVIKELPHRKFLLLGKNWDQYEHSVELAALPNLEIRQNVPYDEYPAIYEECDIYFSASLVEGGGPHSLIEAMMCNMVPVVSTTGNYCEYITHTYNGFYFKPDCKLETIITMIEIAFTLDTDVSKTVRGFTWKMFAKEIIDSLYQNQITEN